MESKVNFSPFTILSFRSTVVESWLLVFHFSVISKPCSANLYFVSKLPSTLPESVFDVPPLQRQHKLVRLYIVSRKTRIFDKNFRKLKSSKISERNGLPDENSTPDAVFVLTSSLSKLKWYPLPNRSLALFPKSP